ncbi:MAG: hypothetical protein HY211_03620 [Candidatus Omnitrophica bacterium]|nr:hypothetical protein [Candidatus Omnitrophota bacterium]
MSFDLDTPYYQIPGSHPEATFGAIMEILLKTRLKLHLETNRELYDEDVNAYLAGLLVSYIDPQYLHAISEVLSAYDIDIFQAVARTEDRYQAYWIYKVNADDLLISVGLFRKFEQQPKGQLVRMKRYYSSASGYQRKIYGKTTAVGEIQTKLAEWTERYLAILAGARQDYMHFVGHRITSEELASLEKRLPLSKMQDEFLDLYSTWLKGARDPALRQRLLELLERIKIQDPTFPADRLKIFLTSP